MRGARDLHTVSRGRGASTGRQKELLAASRSQGRLRTLRAGFAGVAALVVLALPASAAADRSTIFGTPNAYTYLVGTGVNSVTIQAIGGNGGRSYVDQSGSGGRGAVISADLPVSPGETLTVFVGGNGGDGARTGGIGGFNGGRTGAFSCCGGAGAGGGGSDVRRASGERIIVAGGGGGSGGAKAGFNAGSGGVVADGRAGTDVAGGAGGSPLSGAFAGEAGSSGLGGRAGPGMQLGGGGGGGGYFGGGGGGGLQHGCPICDSAGSGGGGSSYVDPSATNVSGPATPGSTNPSVTITPINPPPDTQAPAIDIDTPADVATYSRNEVVDADYTCADEQGGEGIATCAGDVADGSPVDTSTFGSHSFEVTATDNVGNDDTETVSYTVADTTDPAATITAPADNATFAQGQVVNADYSCADETNGSGDASCVGPAANGSPIDTASFGQKTFAVTATDVAGNDFTRTFHYTVTDTVDPTATIDAPLDGAEIPRGQAVNADFSCTDQTGGSGVASCVGDLADGAAIDTSAFGAQSFEVTATDVAGNDSTATASFTVVDAVDPTVRIDSPAGEATFAQDEVVTADYSCSDETDGSGLRSCVGDVAQGAEIDTASAGSHTFGVTATDNEGNRTLMSTQYRVTARTANPGPTPDPDDGESKRPDTEITRFRVNQDKRKLAVGLASEPAGAEFECRLDDGEFAPCDSPATFRRLAIGEHVFKARALGPHGTPDHTPARREFRIGR